MPDATIGTSQVHRPISIARVLCLLGTIGITTAGSAEDAASDVMHLAGRIDGEDVTWLIPAEVSEQSAAYTAVVPEVHRITIHAYRDDRHAREGSIALEMVARPQGVRVTGIHYFPFSENHPRYTYNERYGQVDVSIERAELGVDQGRLSGHLESELFYHQSPRTQPIPHRTTRVELDFDLKLVRN